MLGVCLSSCIPIKQMVFVRKLDSKGDAVGHSTEVQQFLYELKPRDVVRIQLQDDLVFNPQLQVPGTAGMSGSGGAKTYIIDGLGLVKLPEIGDVKIAGMTLFEATEEIERRLVGYITDPIVKVELESYPIKLLGEVNVPGLYEAQSNSPTLFEAIALAQGLSNYANRKEVQLIRTSGEQVNVVYFDITDPDIIESEYYFMHPGDVLVFNPVKAKRFEDRTTTYALSAVSSLVVILNILISR